MAGIGGNVDGGRELAEIEQSSPSLGRLIRKVIQGVNTLATNTAASATGETAPPKPPDSVNVSVPAPYTDPTSGAVLGGGEAAHISIAHSGSLQRGINYFSEIDTNPSFSSPMVVHHGASRTSQPIFLPTNSGITTVNHPDGSKTITPNIATYYVRSYAQYASSQPSKPTVYGGASSPKGIQMSGGTVMALAQSTGSGTAASTGQQGGSGFGKVQQRS